MKNTPLYALPLLALLALPAALMTASAGSLETDSADAASLFDGSGAYTGTAAQAGSSAEGKAKLLAALKTKVSLNDRGTPAEGEALNSILSRVLDSPTGRDLAVKFLQEDAKATISFDIIPDTQILEIKGKKTFWTSGGHAHTDTTPPQVHLNSAYLQARQNEAPETMAHELFGHVLERKRSERYNVTDVYLYNQNEEANAGLIGWTVSAELGNKIENGWAWIYMANPADYHAKLKSNLAYYAGTLSAEEMKDPLPAYQERLKQADALLLRIPVRKKNDELWLKIIDHLAAAHKMLLDGFKSLTEEIQAAIKSVPGNEARLNEIKTYLKQLIAGCGEEKGKPWLDSLNKKSESEYFKEMEKVLEERQKVLAGLMLGKTRDTEQPPPISGQVTWPQLRDMWQKDQDSNCGWKP